MAYVRQEFDETTRLPGREAFLQRLDDELARAERYGTPLSLLLADVNDFAALIRERGAEAGNGVLRHLALALLSSGREADVVARVGTDKFALLLPDTNREGARACAERLGAETAALDMSEDGPPLFVTVSVGTATFGPELAESAALMAHAEEALRAAKNTAPDAPSAAPAASAANHNASGATRVRAFPGE